MRPGARPRVRRDVTVLVHAGCSLAYAALSLVRHQPATTS